MTGNRNNLLRSGESATLRGKLKRIVAYAVIAILLFTAVAGVALQANSAVLNLGATQDNPAQEVGDEDISGGTVADEPLNDQTGNATVSADSNVPISNQVNGNIGVHYKKDNYSNGYHGGNQWQTVLGSDDLPLLEQATDSGKVFNLSGNAAQMAAQWAQAMNYAAGRTADSPYKNSESYEYLDYINGVVAPQQVTGIINENKYIVVRLQNDWNAEYKYYKTAEDKHCTTAQPEGTPYMSFNPVQTHELDWDSPFAYGAIAVPRGVYVVLDLNGHTIDRKMYNVAQEQINMGITEAGRRGFEHGYVISVSPAARMELMDSTATEMADKSRINTSSGVARYHVNWNETTYGSTEYTTNHKGTVKGGWCLVEYSGWNNSSKGSIVHSWPNSDFTFHSGTLTGGASYLGGFIYVVNLAELIVFDGYIVGNFSTNGGGIYLANGCGSTCSVYGGVIALNHALYNGGGLNASIKAYIYYFGGQVVNNRSYGHGAGIYIGSASIGVISNCAITGNEIYANGLGAGIYLHESAVMLKFLGAFKCYDNYKCVRTVDSSNGSVSYPKTAQNVYLVNGAVLQIGGALLGNGEVANIGVTIPVSTSSGTFTKDYGKYNTVAPNNFFFADVTTYQVVTDSSTETKEAALSGSTSGGYTLSWFVEGVAIDNKGGFSNSSESEISSASARNITVDKASATFSYKFMRITKVSAKFYYYGGWNTVCSWSIDPTTAAITPNSISTSFKFKTSAYAATPEQIQGVGARGSKGLEYAGKYSFMIDSTSFYHNPSFTINILQTGLRAEINQYNSGTKLATGQNLTYQGVTIPQLTGLVGDKTGYNFSYYYSDSAFATLMGSNQANDLLNYGGANAIIKYGENEKTASRVDEVKNAGTYHISLVFKNDSTTDVGVDPVANNYVFEGSSSFKILKQQVTVKGNTVDYTGVNQKPITFTPRNTNLSEVLPEKTDFNMFSDSSGTTALTIKNAQTYTNVYVKMVSTNFEIVNASGSVVTVASAGSVTVKPRVVTIEWRNKEFTYDGLGHAPTPVVTNIVAGSGDEVSFDLGKSSKVFVGDSYIATIAGIICKDRSGSVNNNYTIEGLSNAALSCGFIINPRPVVIEWDKLEFTYNGQQQNPVATVKNVVKPGTATDDVKVTIVASESIMAGGWDYVVDATGLTGEAADNYTLVGGKNLEATYHINALELELTFDSLSFVYDGTNRKPVVTMNNIIGTDRVEINVTVGDGRQAIDVGTDYKAVLTLGGPHFSNYKLPAMDEQEGETEKYKIYAVVPRPVVITWEDDSEHEEGDDSLTHEYTGEKWKPTPSISNLADRDIDKNITLETETGMTDVGNYTVRVTGVSDSNYTIVDGENIATDYEITAKKLKVQWAGSTIFTYDGRTSWVPEAYVLTHPRDDIKLIVTGASRIAGKFVATVTGYTAKDEKAYANYVFDSADEDNEIAFEVKPILAIFDWGTAEDRVVTYKRMVLTPTNVKILNMVEGDTIRILFEGGQANIGENIPVRIKGFSNSNYTIEMSGESVEYDGVVITKEEYEANLSNTFTIKPAELTLTWDDEASFEYDGAEHVRRARLHGVIDGDSCAVTYSEDSRKKNAGTHFAVVEGVSNENYVLKAGEELEKEFVITPKAVTVKWNYESALKYNGEEQEVKALPVGGIGDDEIAFIYENNKAKDAGSYTAKVLGVADEETSNYTVVLAEIPELAWKIEAIEITVNMKSVDKIVSLPDGGLNVSDIKDWYAFSTDGLVGADKGKAITSLFSVSDDPNILKPLFVKGSTVVNNTITEEGEYTIRYTVGDKKLVLSGNDNYKATIKEIAGSYGTLYVSKDAVAGLEINNHVEIDGQNVVRQYDFIYEKSEDDGMMLYRRTYTEDGLTHGIDDKDFERIVIGQIGSETCVIDFLKAFDEKLYGQIKLYNRNDELIYDCGQPGSGYTEDDLLDPYSYGIGTGWRMEYGEEVIYLSVLGDLNGDGIVDEQDSATMAEYVMYVQDYTVLEVEYRLAAYVENMGFLDNMDLADLNGIIMYVREVTEFYYAVASEE